MNRQLTELTAGTLAASLSADSIVILPIGAIEQHGPHLPYATDFIMAREYTTATIEQFGDDLDLWMLPPLPYSKSNEHAWSAGTVWLTPETLLATMRDIGRSLAMLPARKLVLLNAHGGNTSLLNVVCRELRLAHGFQTFLVHPSLPADHGGEGHPDEHGLGIHGGMGETSVMLHLRPELVDMDAAVPNIPLWLNENAHVRFGGSVAFGWLSNDFGASGVIGDATLADADLGKAMFEESVSYVGDALSEIARFEFPDRVSA